jgi:hypothetical protein
MASEAPCLGPVWDRVLGTRLDYKLTFLISRCPKKSLFQKRIVFGNTDFYLVAWHCIRRQVAQPPRSRSASSTGSRRCSTGTVGRGGGRRPACGAAGRGGARRPVPGAAGRRRARCPTRWGGEETGGRHLMRRGGEWPGAAGEVGA